MPAKLYSGGPCKRCGGVVRYRSSRACVACDRDKIRRRSLEGHQRAEQRRRYHENPDVERQRVRKWKKTNRAAVAAANAIRRANRTKRTPKWLTKDQKRAMRKLYDEAARLTRVTGVKWHVDHIVPLMGQTVCGLHVPWNLQLLTAAENSSKGNRFFGQAADQSPD